MSDAGRVGAAARVLGFAGLLPQLAAVCLIALHGPMGRMLWPVSGIAIIYPALILSFLGGLWWSIAMRRERGQAWLALLAVVPSLFALVMVTFSTIPGVTGWATASIGIAILLTLPVDRRLTATGEAPAGWMGLRAPLSIGLGALTIAAGALIGGWGAEPVPSIPAHGRFAPFHEGVPTVPDTL